MILYLVNQHGRMFQSHADGNPFGFQLYTVGIQPAVHVSGRMSRSQDNGTEKGLSGLGFNSLHFLSFNQESFHTGLEVYFSAAGQDGVSHILDDPWQFVGSDVRVCIRQDGRTGSVLAEHIQDFFYAAPLLAAGVEFPVGVSACSSFAEAVVGFGIYFMFPADTGQVFFSLTYILSAFYHDGA